MDDVTQTPAHAKPARRDLLWVLVLILACGLLEVWASWLSIGAVSGFPKLGRMTTGWILPVTTEAYWSAALFAWLAVPAGPKSAAFAKWSAAGMFILSLAGQESDHLLAAAGRTAPPVAVVGFVTALPLISVALIAILIHLRQTDRDDAAAAIRERAEAERAAAAEVVATDERTALRAELAALAAEVEPLREALATAQRDAEQANARRETAERKLEAQKANGRRTKPANGTRRTANGPANATAKRAPVTEVPDDFDARAEALEIYLKNPAIKGKDLGEAVGLTARWGQLRRAEFEAASVGLDGTNAPGPSGPS